MLTLSTLIQEGARRAGLDCNIFSERLPTKANPQSAIIQVLSHPLVLLAIFFRALFIFADSEFPVWLILCRMFDWRRY